MIDYRISENNTSAYDHCAHDKCDATDRYAILTPFGVVFRVLSRFRETRQLHIAQWEGMGGVGSARYDPALLPPCPTIRVLSYSN